MHEHDGASVSEVGDRRRIDGRVWIPETEVALVMDRLRVGLVERDAKVFRLAQVLAEIADEDYRGNRSPEAERAHRALVEEGFRACP